MRLIWSPESRRNLLDIREYIEAQASASRAEAMIERVRATARLLLTAPRAGRKVQPEHRDELRVTRVRPFWVYYRIKSETIEVAAVVHYRQRQPARWSE